MVLNPFNIWTLFLCFCYTFCCYAMHHFFEIVKLMQENWKSNFKVGRGLWLNWARKKKKEAHTMPNNWISLFWFLMMRGHAICFANNRYQKSWLEVDWKNSHICWNVEALGFHWYVFFFLSFTSHAKTIHSHINAI